MQFSCIQICISWTCSWAGIRWMGSYHLHISGPILSAHYHIFLRSSNFSYSWKSTSSYSTRCYISHLLNHWYVALPIRFSVPFASFSSSCRLHSVHWLLYRIRLNQSPCRYLENSCRTMQVNISLKKLGKCPNSFDYHRILLLSSFRANRVNLYATTPFCLSGFVLCSCVIVCK